MQPQYSDLRALVDERLKQLCTARVFETKPVRRWSAAIQHEEIHWFSGPLNLKSNLKKCRVWDPRSSFGPEACSLCSLSGWSINAWRNMWSTLYSIATEGIKPTPFWKYIIKISLKQQLQTTLMWKHTHNVVLHSQAHTNISKNIYFAGASNGLPYQKVLQIYVYKYHSHTTIWNTNTYLNTTTQLNTSCKNIGTHPSLI